MSNDSSASHDRILVHKMPAAENALSASTDAGGNSANNCIQAAVRALARRLTTISVWQRPLRILLSYFNV